MRAGQGAGLLWVPSARAPQQDALAYNRPGVPGELAGARPGGAGRRGPGAERGFRRQAACLVAGPDLHDGDIINLGVVSFLFRIEEPAEEESAGQAAPAGIHFQPIGGLRERLVGASNDA